MNVLTTENMDNFLKRFEKLDGAVVKEIYYQPSSSSDDCEIKVVLKASDSFVTGSKLFSGEVTLEILAKGNVEFRVYEPGGGVNVVINDEAVGYSYDDKIYINFDPLHSKNWETKSWSIDEIRSSTFYIGGNKVFWAIVNH